ncbi:sugar phosphate isomerase/epimerase family protein [Paenibacillus piri]|uniref:Sugar phosphate isomerase/epimerase n=1 Tax=Paenibacillus piri TaxID=2547395 RepID=A0A4R5KY21_9BACL|nr:TIM barrel protein [Paenibacillus piri]TDG00119.1 sugar phosphate isomerase/epimerase [Paenibacillus piri]
MPYLSVSTWSLHRLLGPLRLIQWDADADKHTTLLKDQPEVLTLLELPGEAARRGYKALEVCHFHFPSTERDYLRQLREAFAAAAISFDTLLLDYGDLTAADPVRREADLALIRSWIDIASHAGAKQIRIVAGDAQPTDEEAIRQSAAALSELAGYGSERCVRVISENFRALTSTAASCVSLLEQAGPEVGFITDFGNFQLPGKYEEFASTLPRSVSVHAKAQYDDNGFPDEAEFSRCLETVKADGFQGAMVLIYDGPGDMWEGLERIRTRVQPYL